MSKIPLKQLSNEVASKDFVINKITEAKNDFQQNTTPDIQNEAVDYIIVSYYDETNLSWYRLYASGWIIQGGEEKYGSQQAQRTINFPIPMASGTYNLTITRLLNYSGMTTTYPVRQRYTYGFNIQAGETGILWEVTGWACDDAAEMAANNI